MNCKTLYSSSIRTGLLILLSVLLLSACGGGSSSSANSPASISSLQTQLADVKAQLATAQAQTQTDSPAIAAAIAALSQTQAALDQLGLQPASVVTPVVMLAVSDQVLVLKSLVDKVTVSASTVSKAYTDSQSSLAALNAQLASLQAQVTTLTASGGSSAATITSQASQISSLNAQITTLNGQIATLQAASNALAAQLAAANGTITTQATQISTLNGQIATLATGNTSMTSQLTAANAQINTLNSQITALNGQITTLTSNNTALAANNTSLSTQLTTANNTVTTLSTQVNVLQSQLDSSNASNTDLTNQLAAATFTITSLSSQVSSLTALLNTANATIATRDATIATLNSSITSLNAQISAIVATPVLITTSATSSFVNTPVTVTVTFPNSSQDGKTVTFSSQGGGGSFSATTATISGGTATTTFNSNAAGTFNINAVANTYAGGATVSFIPTQQNTYSISGQIGSTAGVTLLATDTNGAAYVTMTDLNGRYTLAGLPNGNYTILPVKFAEAFIPISLSVALNGTNLTGKDFANYHTSTAAVISALPPFISFPVSPSKLIQASDGNFYGTSSFGGANDMGMVFKTTPSGITTVLYSFSGGAADGAYPTAGLVQASDGNLYGTTSSGGLNTTGMYYASPNTPIYSLFATWDQFHPNGVSVPNNGGTVFKITTSGALTVLHYFSGVDGANPVAALIQASDGNLYGTTMHGGTNNTGTVFGISTSGAFSVLHSFGAVTLPYSQTATSADGAWPSAGLVQGSDGNLYGTTSGSFNKGAYVTVNGNQLQYVFIPYAPSTTFMITPSGAFTLIYASMTESYQTDLAVNQSGMYGVTASGKIYELYYYPAYYFYGSLIGINMGLRYTGAAVSACGKVTLISEAQQFWGLGMYGPGTLGSGAYIFWGISECGGQNGLGIIFNFYGGDSAQVVYSFGGAAGANPTGIVQANDGNFYGATNFYGASNSMIFKFAP